MTLEARKFIIKLFDKTANNQTCRMCKKKINLQPKGKNEKIVFSRPFFGETGKDLLIGYVRCEKCHEKNYVKLCIENL